MGAMTVDRHELHDLIDELPEDQAALVMADVRRRLAKPKPEGTWPPEFFGIIDGGEVPTDLARNVDDFLAASGFGRDSL
jgi:hypothetical protein